MSSFAIPAIPLLPYALKELCLSQEFKVINCHRADFFLAALSLCHLLQYIMHRSCEMGHHSNKGMWETAIKPER